MNINNKSTLFIIADSLTLICIFILTYGSDAEITHLVISVLGSFCVLLIDYLCYIIFKKHNICCVIEGCIALLFILYSPHIMFGLILLVSIQLTDRLMSSGHKYQLFAVYFLISLFLFSPPKDILAISVISTGLTLFCMYILDKLSVYIDLNMQQKDMIAMKDKKINDINSFASSIKQQTALQERKRIAERMHDDVGHGISGSIIMLEASLLLMKTDTAKAEQGIKTATDNLRKGVDNIRMALREERPEKLFIGISNINSMLKEFELAYNTHTKLTSTGNLENITSQIWQCVFDNLNEALTNMLKHSSGNEFCVDINVLNKMLKIQFSDNGECTGEIKKSIGLEAIEERTLKCGGKCLFTAGQNGFSMIFLFNI